MQSTLDTHTDKHYAHSVCVCMCASANNITTLIFLHVILHS